MNLHVFFCRFQLEDDGPKSVVTATDCDAGLVDPNPIVKNIISSSMGKCKHCGPRFVAGKFFRLGMIWIKKLSLFHHRTGGQAFDTVFISQFFIQSSFEDCNFYFFILLPLPFLIDFFNREDKSSGSSLMSVLVDYANVAAKGTFALATEGSTMT